MKSIALSPDGPTTRARHDLGRGARSLHLRQALARRDVQAPVHVVFYRVTGPVIEIIRVLHERMDPARHVPKARKPRGA